MPISISKPVLNCLENRLKRYLSRLNLSRVFLRRCVAESAMWPSFAVIPPPDFDLVLGIIPAKEPVLIEVFLPEPAIEPTFRMNER